MDKVTDIFLIDDDFEEAELFGDAISRINDDINLTCFSNGQDAIESIRTSPPSLVFLDLNIPVFPGKEILKSLREFDQTTKVVIYSTSITQKDVDETQSFVVTYLQKPDDFQTLCSRLAEVIKT